MATNYLQCERCGDDSDKYIKFILYDCFECGKKKLCESCIEFAYHDDTYISDKKPFCSECYEKKEDIRKCNSCYRVLQCKFSTCFKCHKKNICINCVYDDNNSSEDIDEKESKPICSECDEKYIQEQRATQIARQKERIKHLKKIVCSVCIKTIDFRCYSNNLNDNLCSKCVIIANKTI
jgi:hypothetical protein